MKIAIVSDIHINSYFSKEEKFLKLIKYLEVDKLIINGDLYDLYIGPPSKKIYNAIKNNPKIKDIVYIRGNHDFNITDYFPELEVVDFFEIADVYITHGHQYDFLSSSNPTGKGISKWSVVFRYYLEKIFKLNFRILLKKITFGLIDFLLMKAQKKAVKLNPNKKVILGHTHNPMNKPPYYNNGCMVDEYFTYIVVNIQDGVSTITLVEE